MGQVHGDELGTGHLAPPRDVVVGKQPSGDLIERTEETLEAQAEERFLPPVGAVGTRLITARFPAVAAPPGDAARADPWWLCADR